MRDNSSLQEALNGGWPRLHYSSYDLTKSSLGVADSILKIREGNCLKGQETGSVTQHSSNAIHLMQQIDEALHFSLSLRQRLFSFGGWETFWGKWVFVLLWCLWFLFLMISTVNNMRKKNSHQLSLINTVH